MLFGVGIPYYTNVSRTQGWGEIEETYGVEQVYRLIFMDRKEAPLSCRRSLENRIKFKIITPRTFPNTLREQTTLLS
jgi:hypothetical protein